MPRLANAAFGGAQAADNGLLTANWRMGDGTSLTLRANLSDHDIADRLRESGGTPIWGGLPGDIMKPWSVVWCLEPR
jgi:maltooligosyltrehalose trehalohydrolase